MKLFGRNVVVERLRANPSSIQRLYVESHNESLMGIRKKAQAAKIPIALVSSLKIEKMSHGKNAQGVICEVAEYTYTPYDRFWKERLKIIGVWSFSIVCRTRKI